MRKIVYHAGTSLDNFIAQPNGSISGFLGEGDHVTHYLESLKAYNTVLMGKATHEFGYQYGLQPGQPAYPHMQHCIFSKTLRFEAAPDQQVVVVSQNEADCTQQLNTEKGTDIYLCGGGVFAGFLLEQELIDELRINMYPVLLGSGIRLFENSTKQVTDPAGLQEVFQRHIAGDLPGGILGHHPDFCS